MDLCPHRLEIKRRFARKGTSKRKDICTGLLSCDTFERSGISYMRLPKLSFAEVNSNKFVHVHLIFSTTGALVVVAVVGVSPTPSTVHWTVSSPFHPFAPKHIKPYNHIICLGVIAFLLLSCINN